MTGQCRGLTPTGDRCQVTTNLSPEGLCLWHDPAREEAAQAARRRGGKRRPSRKQADVRVVDPDTAPDPPETLDDIVTWASWTAYAVATGTVDARTAREISYALSTLRTGLEKRDLARDVARLRRDLDQLKKGRTTE